MLLGLLAAFTSAIKMHIRFTHSANAKKTRKLFKTMKEPSIGSISDVQFKYSWPLT